MNVKRKETLQQTPIRMALTLLTVTVMALIFWFSTEDAERSDATSGVFSRMVIAALYPEYESYPAERQQELYDEIQHAVRKTAHFTEYAVLGFLMRLCIESWVGKRRLISLVSWLTGTLYACTDEIHQLLTDGRSGQWTDVLIDSGGVLTGVLIVILLLILIRRRILKRETEKE